MRSDRDARLEALDAYSRGGARPGGSDPDAYEDELFARAADGTAEELAYVDRIGAGVRDLAERGTLDPWITAAEADALRARYGAALSLRDHATEHPVTLEVPVSAEVVVTRIPLELEGVERLDLEVLTADGVVVKTMADVRFEPGDGAIYACCEGQLARQTVDIPLRTRVWATVGGERRVARELVTRVVLGS